MRLIRAAVAALSIGISSRAAAQSARAATPMLKNPTTAVALSAIVPGAGQLYTGHVLRGLTELAMAAGGAALVARACRGTANCTGNRELGWTLAGGAWLLSVYQAGDDAREYGQPPPERASDARLAGRLVAAIGPVIAQSQPSVDRRLAIEYTSGPSAMATAVPISAGSP